MNTNNSLINSDKILNQGIKPSSDMSDILGNILSVNDTVLFPAGKELMKGTIQKINHTKKIAFVKNEAGYSKWKISSALIKI